MVDGSNSVMEILINNGFNLKKSLGQNFLIDRNITKKIVRLSGITALSNVLEIGPGVGALTTSLCQSAKSVVAVELDKRLLPILHDVLKPYDNIKIIQGDVLKLDIKSLVAEYFLDSECCVCANLPYNITTPILQTLIEATSFSNITVMIQREVAKRICAKPGTTEYGAFTLYINYHCDPEILFDVPPDCFVPKPKVFSSVVTMKIKQKRLLGADIEKTFFRVVRASFGQRRKTLVNALHSDFGDLLSKEVLNEIVVKCGFDSRVRGEMLSLNEFIELSKILHQMQD